MKEKLQELAQRGSVYLDKCGPQWGWRAVVGLYEPLQSRRVVTSRAFDRPEEAVAHCIQIIDKLEQEDGTN